MKRIKLLTLSCLMSLSLPSFAQFSPDHKVSLDKGDIKSFIGDKESKGERKVYKGDELTTIGMPVGEFITFVYLSFTFTFFIPYE